MDSRIELSDSVRTTSMSMMTWRYEFYFTHFKTFRLSLYSIVTPTGSQDDLLDLIGRKLRFSACTDLPPSLWIMQHILVCPVHLVQRGIVLIISESGQPTPYYGVPPTQVWRSSNPPMPVASSSLHLFCCYSAKTSEFPA